MIHRSKVTPRFAIHWHASGRGKAQCPTNPMYPKGIDVVDPAANPGCKVDLPYPAKECGVWILKCHRCGNSIAVTAAGRPDDPRSVKVACCVTHTQGRKQ